MEKEINLMVFISENYKMTSDEFHFILGWCVFMIYEKKFQPLLNGLICKHFCKIYQSSVGG